MPRKCSMILFVFFSGHMHKVYIEFLQFVGSMHAKLELHPSPFLYTGRARKMSDVVDVSTVPYHRRPGCFSINVIQL